MSTQVVPTDVVEYFGALPDDRRAVVEPVFDTVHRAVPDGYELSIGWGMPTWSVPLTVYPETYNGQPLAFVSLAAQKNYNSLFLMMLYSDSEEDLAFRREWAATGRKLNMGKSCLRFRRADDVDLDILARTIQSWPVDRFLATYERIRQTPAK